MFCTCLVYRLPKAPSWRCTMPDSLDGSPIVVRCCMFQACWWFEGRGKKLSLCGYWSWLVEVSILFSSLLSPAAVHPASEDDVGCTDTRTRSFDPCGSPGLLIVRRHVESMLCGPAVVREEGTPQHPLAYLRRSNAIGVRITLRRATSKN